MGDKAGFGTPCAAQAQGAIVGPGAGFSRATPVLIPKVPSDSTGTINLVERGTAPTPATPKSPAKRIVPPMN